MTDTRPWFRTVSSVLDSLSALQRADVVCFADVPLSPGDRCVVCDSRDMDEDEDIPREATAEGLTICLTARQIKGVVDNLTQQVDQPNRDLVLEALSYYVENDAYLSVG